MDKEELRTALLNKFYNNLSKKSIWDRLSFVAKLSRDFKVSPYRLRKELGYLEELGVVKHTKYGVEKMYELTIRGEKIIWHFKEFIGRPIDELLGMIEDANNYENIFNRQLQLTHCLAYNSVLTSTRVKSLQIPEVAIVRDIVQGAGAHYDKSTNTVQIRLAINYGNHFINLLFHENAHSVQARINPHIGIPDSEDRKYLNRFDPFEIQDSRNLIFQEGFAMLFDEDRDGSKFALESTHIYGSELFDTIKFAKGFDYAVGFGLYEKPTVKNMEKEYLESCRLLNKQRKIKIEDAVINVSKKWREQIGRIY